MLPFLYFQSFTSLFFDLSLSSFTPSHFLSFFFLYSSTCSFISRHFAIKPSFPLSSFLYLSTQTFFPFLPPFRLPFSPPTSLPLNSFPPSSLHLPQISTIFPYLSALSILHGWVIPFLFLPSSSMFFSIFSMLYGWEMLFTFPLFHFPALYTSSLPLPLLFYPFYLSSSFLYFLSLSSHIFSSSVLYLSILSIYLHLPYLNNPSSSLSLIPCFSFAVLIFFYLFIHPLFYLLLLTFHLF